MPVAMFGFVISRQNSISGGSERRIISTYKIGFDQIHREEVNKAITAGLEKYDLFKIHGLMYKVGNIPIGGICAVRLHSRNG